MLVAVAVYSFFPTLAAKSLAKIDPVTLVMLANFFSMAAFGFLIGLNTYLNGWASIGSKLRCWRENKLYWYAISGGIINFLSHFFLIYSFHKMNKAAATVIYEIWPVFAMLFIPLAFWMEERAKRSATPDAVGNADLYKKKYRKMQKRDMVAAVSAFLGFMIIVGSRPFALTPDGAASSIGASGGDSLIFGCVLALLACITMAASSVLSVRQGDQLKEHLKIAKGSRDAAWTVPIFTIFCDKVVSFSLAALLYPVLTNYFPDLLGLNESSVSISLNLNSFNLGVSAIYGIAIMTPGALFYVAAVQTSRYSSINLLWCLTTLISLFILALSGEERITVYIAIGTIFVMVGLLLSATRAESSHAYDALIIAILVSCVVCYFLPGLDVANYYRVISVPIMLFSIVIAFMVNRKSQAIYAQEQQVLVILDGLSTDDEEEVPEGQPEPEFSTGSYARGANKNNVAVAVINSLNQTPIEFGRKLPKLKQMLGDADNKLHRDVARLIFIRMNLFSFSELVAAGTIGVFAVLSGIFFRPPTFESDILAAILATTIAFLLFTLKDRRSTTAYRELKGFARTKYRVDFARARKAVAEDGDGEEQDLDETGFPDTEEPGSDEEHDKLVPVIPIVFLIIVYVGFTVALLDKHAEQCAPFLEQLRSFIN